MSKERRKTTASRRGRNALLAQVMVTFRKDGKSRNATFEGLITLRALLRRIGITRGKGMHVVRSDGEELALGDQLTREDGGRVFTIQRKAGSSHRTPALQTY